MATPPYVEGVNAHATEAGQLVRQSPLMQRELDADTCVEEAYVAYQFVAQPVVIVPSVEVEFPKLLRPEKVLLLERSEEEAAVIVCEPPSAIDVPLTVSEALASWPLPIVELAMTLPFTSVARRDIAAGPVNHVEPETVNPVVEALVKYVVDAMTMVSLSHKGVVVD